MDAEKPRVAEPPKRPALPYLGLAAVVVTLVWWAHAYMIPGYTGFTNDDATYLASARALAEGKGYVLQWAMSGPHPADRFPIGFPALLAPFFLIPEGLDEHVRWIQETEVVVAAGFIVAAFLYAYRFLQLPAWACLGGAALVVLSPFTPYLAGLVMSDLPFGLLFTIALWQAHKALADPVPKRLVLAAVLSAASVLVRYAGAVLPACLVAWYLVKKQYRAAALYGAITGLLLLPWVAWVAKAKAFGYAAQIAHQGAASNGMRVLSLAYSAALVFAQSIPSFLMQALYLPAFPERSPAPVGDFALVAIGLAISALFVAGVALCLKSGPLRFPVSVFFGYLALILVWQTGFLNLGEHLTIRLLLPLMPVASALALFGWSLQLQGNRRPNRALAIALGAALLLTVGTQAALVHAKMVQREVPLMKVERAALYGIFREFARQVPAEDAAATNVEPLFHLLTGRKCYSLTSNPGFITGLIADTPVKYFVAVPVSVGGKDLILEAVKAVNRQVPGSIYIIYTDRGQPLGVFRVDRKAFQDHMAKQGKV